MAITVGRHDFNRSHDHEHREHSRNQHNCAAPLQTELNTALAVIKQMERENATLAFQVKGLLAKRERQAGKNNEPAP